MRILICGAGALGSNITALLACDLKGEHEITVLDMDKVEERNVQAGTQFYQKDQIGMSKVEALQYNIYKWYERNIDIINQELTLTNADTILQPWIGGLIIDCFDNYTARLGVHDRVKSRHLNCVHTGFSDQFTFAIEWGEKYKVPTDITSGFDICEMEGAASFVKMVSSLAGLTILDYIKNNKKREFIGNKFIIREIK